VGDCNAPCEPGLAAPCYPTCRWAIKLTPVAPVGSHRSNAFVRATTGCTYREIEVLDYPPSPDGERLRALRQSLDLSLRDACQRLGLRPSELSSLEHGRATTDWAEVERRLR
jgi:hypothetical protein